MSQEEKRIAKLNGLTQRYDGTLDDQGQPNIIDYVNHEPMLTSLSERGLGGGQPGTILPNNEPSSRSPKPTDGFRPGGVHDKSTCSQSGCNKTQPGITTGAPTTNPNPIPTENEEMVSIPIL